MLFRCEKCQKTEPSRHLIRAHVRREHGYTRGYAKGGDTALSYARITTQDSETTIAYHGRSNGENGG